MKSFFSVGFLLFSIGLLATALPAQTLERVEAMPLEPGAPAVLRFWFTAEGAVAPAWRVGLVLPAFDLERVLFADSRRLNGGFNVRVAGDTVWVMRSGAGDSLAAAARFDLLVAMVGLPGEVAKPIAVEWRNRQSGIAASFRKEFILQTMDKD